MIGDEVLMKAPPEKLTGALEQFHGVTCEALGHLFQSVRVADDRNLWSEDGAASLEAWLAARLGIADKSAARYVRLARALRDLPAIAAALERGEISLDKADALIRLAAATENALLQEARSLSVAQLESRRA